MISEARFNTPDVYFVSQQLLSKCLKALREYLNWCLCAVNLCWICLVMCIHVGCYRQKSVVSELVLLLYLKVQLIFLVNLSLQTKWRRCCIITKSLHTKNSPVLLWCLIIDMSICYTFVWLLHLYFPELYFKITIVKHYIIVSANVIFCTVMVSCQIS